MIKVSRKLALLATLVLALAAFLIPSAVLADEFSYDKDGIKFILEYPDGSTKGEPTSKTEVLRMTAPGGLPVVTCNVYKLDDKSPKLEDNHKGLEAIFNSIGSDTEVIGHEMVKTEDGTPGQKYEVEWMWGGSTLLTTNGINVYKNGWAISVSVTHMGDPDDIMDIIESLEFE